MFCSAFRDLDWTGVGWSAWKEWRWRSRLSVLLLSTKPWSLGNTKQQAHVSHIGRLSYLCCYWSQLVEENYDNYIFKPDSFLLLHNKFTLDTEVSSLGLKGGANIFRFLIWWDFLVPFGFVSRSRFRDCSDFSDFSRCKPRVFRFVCASWSTIFGSQESCIPIKANFQTHVLHCLTMLDMSLESYLHFYFQIPARHSFWEHEIL